MISTFSSQLTAPACKLCTAVFLVHMEHTFCLGQWSLVQWLIMDAHTIFQGSHLSLIATNKTDECRWINTRIMFSKFFLRHPSLKSAKLPSAVSSIAMSCLMLIWNLLLIVCSRLMICHWWLITGNLVQTRTSLNYIRVNKSSERCHAMPNTRVWSHNKHTIIHAHFLITNQLAHTTGMHE